MSRQPGAGDLTPREEVSGRIAGLKERMATAGIDFALIMQNVDLFYFTGSAQKGILIVPLDGDPVFFVQRTIERAREESPLTIVPIISDKDLGRLREGKDLLKGQGGMEGDVVPFATYDRIKKITGIDHFTDISDIIKDLRQVKSPFELEQIKASGVICDRAHQRARDVIKEGLRELDIDAELLLEARKAGHQGFLRMRGFNQEMMNLYVSSGYTGTIPSAGDVPVAGLGFSPAIAQGSSLKRVERGIPVLVDFGGGYNGYITDETRSYVVGELKEVFRKPYEVSREIVEETQEFAKAGIDTTDIYAKALERVRKAGLEQHFMGYGHGQVSFIGHGLGLEINELPVITARHHTILKEGMVFAFEPKFTFPDEGVIGIEVDFIVRKDRAERVTATPIDLVVL